MKYILVIGDGMADNPLEELGGKTPLEYVHKPSIDALAAAGSVGSALTVPEGQPPGSDTAILSIFGSDPNLYYTGRSPLEAAGGGVKLSEGDASFRCNMVAYEDSELPFDEKVILSHSAGSIEGEQSLELIGYLLSQPEFKEAASEAAMKIFPNPSFRHIAILEKTDIKGMSCTPPHDILGSKIGGYKPSGNPNSERLWRLMELAHKLLDAHPVNEKRRSEGKLPANGIWFWAEGTAVALPSFEKMYGKTGSVISAVPLVHGIGALMGLESIEVEGTTGETESNYEGKVDAAVAALKTGRDFVCIHVEAPDEASHNGNLEEKLLSLEYLDRRVIKRLVEALKAENMDYRLLFLSDHKTLMSTRTHDGDPVPFMIYDSRTSQGQGLSYDEKSAEQGVYLDPGTGLMPLLFGM